MTIAPENRGWMASGVFHLLILLIFAFWKLQIAPFILDFTPLAFAPLADVGSLSPSVAAALDANAPSVELPRRPMLEEESPLLHLPSKLRPELDVPISRERQDILVADQANSARRTLIPSIGSGRTDRPVTTALPVNEGWLTGEQHQAATGSLTGDEMFEIAWEGVQRLKISGELPTFPKEVSRATVIRIAFTVSPDGIVVTTVPSTKGVPELERVSMDALKSWRFNRLDAGSPQANQSGEITFRYQLK